MSQNLPNMLDKTIEKINFGETAEELPAEAAPQQPEQPQQEEG